MLNEYSLLHSFYTWKNLGADITGIQNMLYLRILNFNSAFKNWEIIYIQWNEQIINGMFNEFWRIYVLCNHHHSKTYEIFLLLYKVSLCPFVFKLPNPIHLPNPYHYQLWPQGTTVLISIKLIQCCLLEFLINWIIWC